MTECPPGATKWAAAVSGNYTDPARWTAGVPAGNAACIDLPGSYVVTYNVNGTLFADSLLLGDPSGGTQPTLRMARGVLSVTNDVSSYGRLEFVPTGIGINSSLEAGGSVHFAPTATLTTANNGGTIEASSVENEGAVVTGTGLVLRTNSFVNRGSVVTTVGTVRLEGNGSPPAARFEAGSVDAGAGRFDQVFGTTDVIGGTLTGSLDLIQTARLTLNGGSGGQYSLIPPAGQGAAPQLNGVIDSTQTVFVGTFSTHATTTGLINRGELTIRSTGGLGNSGVDLKTLTGGSFVNVGTTTIDGGALAGTVVNEGLITIAAGSGTFLSPALTNRGTISIPAGENLAVRADTDGAAPAVVLEDGVVDAVGTWSQSGGTMDVHGGTLNGDLDLFALNRLTLDGGTGGEYDLMAPGGGGAVPTLSGTIGATQTVVIGTVSVNAQTDGLVNQGQLTVRSIGGLGNSGVFLRTRPGATFTNHGTTTIDAGNLVGTITNESDGTIAVAAGSGTVLSPSPLTNRGMVTVPLGETLAVRTDTGGSAPQVVNDGGALNLAGSYTQSGGSFQTVNGDVTATGVVSFNTVRFSGVGTWARTLALSVGGALAPGTSAGRLAITGDYSPSTATVTEIELGGGEPGAGYDQVDVSAVAHFAGSLSVRLTDGFIPRTCQTFDVFTYGARTGTFANSGPIDLGGGMFLRQVYGTNGLTLVAYTTSQAVNVSPTEVQVSEDGLTDTYDVCLPAAPAATTIVTVSPDEQVAVDKSSLVFDLATWQLPQTVTVSAVDDDVFEPTPHMGLIQHAASNGAAVASVTAQIADDGDLPNPPTAVDDEYSVDEDATLDEPAPGVLANDSDPQGQPLSAVLLTGPSSGSLTLNADGSFTYVPNANFHGADSFTYKASDGTFDSAPATVRITVNPINDAPIAHDNAYSVDEDTTLDVAAPGVLGNDDDVDGDSLRAVLVSGPTNGSLGLNADGSFTYMPNGNFNGADSFTYSANDGTLDSAPATVAITVNPVNDAPVAAADGPYLGIVGDPVALDGSASSDVDGDALTYSWDFGDGSTLVTSSPTPTHTYAAPGIYEVMLVVNDGSLDSQPATTTATIGDSIGSNRSDVDAFLSYAAPTKRSVQLPAGTTSFDVTILYGAPIIPATFEASLEGAPFTDFNPAPGTSETVTVPLGPGRNVLELSVDGTLADGRTATDRDRLTFIVG